MGRVIRRLGDWVVWLALLSIGFAAGFWCSEHGRDLVSRMAAWSNPGWDGRFHQGAGKPAQSERWKAKKLEAKAGH